MKKFLERNSKLYCCVVLIWVEVPSDKLLYQTLSQARRLTGETDIDDSKL